MFIWKYVPNSRFCDIFTWYHLRSSQYFRSRFHWIEKNNTMTKSSVLPFAFFARRSIYHDSINNSCWRQPGSNIRDTFSWIIILQLTGWPIQLFCVLMLLQCVSRQIKYLISMLINYFHHRNNCQNKYAGGGAV